MRHSWHETHQTYAATHSACWHCGLERAECKDRGERWNEYRAPGGIIWFTPERVPACGTSLTQDKWGGRP